MTVEELIEELKCCPPKMEVCVWDEFDDEFVTVKQALQESGVTYVQLLTVLEDTIPASEP